MRNGPDRPRSRASHPPRRPTARRAFIQTMLREWAYARLYDRKRLVVLRLPPA